MSKARLLGMNKPYIPNFKADMRFRKKAYQRGRIPDRKRNGNRLPRRVAKKEVRH